jgi:hypothetical protein
MNYAETISERFPAAAGAPSYYAETISERFPAAFRQDLIRPSAMKRGSVCVRGAHKEPRQGRDCLSMTRLLYHQFW